MCAALIRIATRESPLALWQAEYVKARLLAAHPALQVELVPMTTRSDQILSSPLSQIGGKGLFITELEVTMLEGRADNFPMIWALLPVVSAKIAAMRLCRIVLPRWNNYRRAPSLARRRCGANAGCVRGDRIWCCAICAATSAPVCANSTTATTTPLLAGRFR